MTTRPSRLWVGIDASKAHHWWVAIDDTGTTVWSRKVGNYEIVILAALSEVRDLADEVCWAVDLTGTAPALLLALLASYGQHVVYVPGRTVNRMSGTYRGEAKTDARDAYVIADTARLRQGFAPVEVPTDLALLTTHCTDLIADRVRLLNRLHDVLTGISPALEAAFDYADHKGALVLLTGYPTPAALRRCGRTRLTRWLTARGVRHPETVALTALTAAHPAATSQVFSSRCAVLLLPSWKTAKPAGWKVKVSKGPSSRSARKSSWASPTVTCAMKFSPL
ncbi:hypothetical protein SUDANB21_00582 [Streptomyces sp. enrichment culture]